MLTDFKSLYYVSLKDISRVKRDSDYLKSLSAAELLDALNFVGTELADDKGVGYWAIPYGQGDYVRHVEDLVRFAFLAKRNSSPGSGDKFRYEGSPLLGAK